MKMLSDPTYHIMLFKAGMDLSSFGIVAGTLAGYLPPMAAGLALIWTAIQITEWALKKFRHTKHHQHR